MVMLERKLCLSLLKCTLSNMKKIIIILIIVLMAGGAVYFLTGKKIPGIGGGTEKALEELSVTAPEVDMSLSPLPKLNVSSFNLSSPQLPANNIFSGFSVDADFSYSGNLDISTPSIQITAPTIPTGVPSAQAPSSPSTEQPVEQPAQQSSQGAVNASNCAAFSAVPSSQYCSMTGASGQALCEQCKAEGY